ncbi:hypothetical protein F4808DRAFT_152966 [Astrocystis sublimbata]|nr:hypothetical protein F4808DRAFT_102532 [Astrocystis sublimbata]KAI0200813.1 hypothetical protein F4808DRAFT_152966 [Astrocystis sublimbata]
MHYIRLLRPPKFQGTAGGAEISLLLTITTDLGDSFMCPGEPIDLIVDAVNPADTISVLSRGKPAKYKWKAGMRILDAKVKFQPGLDVKSLSCSLAIYPARQRSRGTSTPLGALHVGDVLPWRGGKDDILATGAIMPATVQIRKGEIMPWAWRTLALGRGHLNHDHEGDTVLCLRFMEDVGESIARHIWDAGLLMSAYLVDACSSLETIRELFPVNNETYNVLELGSGVGILGITIASILPMAAAAQGQVLKHTVVQLTDLEDARHCAEMNLASNKTLSVYDSKPVDMAYEDLDWDEGCEGRFAPSILETSWDMVVLSDCTYNVDSLPSLVGTLSALHAVKGKDHGLVNTDLVRSSVLLATKPRHSSEEALFGLLKDHHWTFQVVKEITLPKIGEDDDVVLIYRLGKETRAA